MEKLLPLHERPCQNHNHRSGEIKFGKNAYDKRSRCYNLLQNSEAKYVLVGIPEDIGVRAIRKTWCRFSMGHSN
jgi:formiminoglutamase